MKQKENSYGFQYNGYQGCSGLSSNKRTNGLQTGPEQEATSNKIGGSWKVKKKITLIKCLTNKY